MKQILIYLLLSLISVAVFAQEYQYVPFPDSNAVWSEVYWKPMSEPSPNWVYNKYALFNEDTVIKDITYHKLFYTNASEIVRENATCIGAIREDSLKCIWYYNISFPFKEWMPSRLYEQNEIKLYDFMVSKGDTIREINTLLEYEFIVVKQIDTISYKKSLRKVFSFNIPWVYWIEGIGNVKGLLFTSGDLPSNGMDNDLVCFHQNDTLIYYYSGNEYVHYDSCVPSFVLNGVALLPNPDVKVYPNPITGSRVYFENLAFDELSIYDEHGCLILAHKIKDADSYELDISFMSSGIYFYQLKKQGLLPTGGKLIIP